MSPLSGAFLEKKHDIITWVTKLDLEENEKERQKKARKKDRIDTVCLIFPHEN